MTRLATQEKSRLSGGFFDRELAVNEIQKRALTVEHGFHRHPSSPELIEVAQGFFGIFELQVTAVMVVLQQQRTIIIIIGIFNFDHGNRAGANVLNQSLLDLAPIFFIGDPAHYLFIATLLVLEQVELSN